MEIVIPKRKIRYISFDRDICIRLKESKFILWANKRDLSSQYKEILSKFKDDSVKYLEFSLNHDDYDFR